jgi:hypothetical protein
MRHNEARYDRILVLAETARRDYRALLAAVPDHIKQADHVILIGHWLDDVEGIIVPGARMATDDVIEGRWLTLAVTTIQQVRMLLDSVRVEADEARRA